MEIFPESFFSDLPQDPLEAESKMLDDFLAAFGGDKSPAQHWEDYAIAIGQVNALRLGNGSTEIGLPRTNDASGYVSNLHSMVNNIAAERRQELFARKKENAMRIGKERFEMFSGKLFCYKLSDDEVSRIQRLLNELRDSIRNAEDLEDRHKNRLLKRLEQLQTELNKPLTDLDRIWGMAGDAIVTAQKMAGDPNKRGEFLKYARLLLWIIWEIETNVHKLPPGTPHPMLEGTPPEQHEPASPPPAIDV